MHCATTHALLRRATWGLRYITQHTCEATTPALLRRATVIDDFAVNSNAATTHALLRRATAQCKLFHDKTQSYNSRSPAESDRRCVRCGRRYGCSNSRSPTESDRPLRTQTFKKQGYNTRSPAESDDMGNSADNTPDCYNSRSPAESDRHE